MTLNCFIDLSNNNKFIYFKNVSNKKKSFFLVSKCLSKTVFRPLFERDKLFKTKNFFKLQNHFITIPM